MTNGTSQGLFVVVAIVIFGIFVALSYTVFGSMSEGLDSLVNGHTQEVTRVMESYSNMKLIDIRTVRLEDGAAQSSSLDRNIRLNTLQLTSFGGRTGIEIPTRDVLDEGKDYIMTFKLRLDDGQIKRLGGHVGGTGGDVGEGISNVKVFVDGVHNPTDDPNAAENDWYTGVPLINEVQVGDVVDVEVHFTLDFFSESNYVDQPIKIQPNRNFSSDAPSGNGYLYDYKLTISDLYMVEVEE